MRKIGRSPSPPETPVPVADAFFHEDFVGCDPKHIAGTRDAKRLLITDLDDAVSKPLSNAKRYLGTITPEQVDAYKVLIGAPPDKPVQQPVPRSKVRKLAGGLLAVTVAAGLGVGVIAVDRHYVGMRYRYYNQYGKARLNNRIASDAVTDGMNMVTGTDTINPEKVPGNTHVQVPFSFDTLLSLQKHVADFGRDRSTSLVAQRLKDGTLKLSPVERRFVRFAVDTNRQELAALPAETERMLHTALAQDKAADAATAHAGIGRKLYVERGASQEAVELAGRSMRFLVTRQK